MCREKNQQACAVTNSSEFKGITTLTLVSTWIKRCKGRLLHLCGLRSSALEGFTSLRDQEHCGVCLGSQARYHGECLQAIPIKVSLVLGEWLHNVHHLVVISQWSTTSRTPTESSIAIASARIYDRFHQQHSTPSSSSRRLFSVVVDNVVPSRDAHLQVLAMVSDRFACHSTQVIQQPEPT